MLLTSVNVAVKTSEMSLMSCQTKNSHWILLSLKWKKDEKQENTNDDVCNLLKTWNVVMVESEGIKKRGGGVGEENCWKGETAD